MERGLDMAARRTVENFKFKNKMVILDRIDASVSSAQSERCFCELASLGLLRLRRCIYIEG